MDLSSNVHLCDVAPSTPLYEQHIMVKYHQRKIIDMLDRRGFYADLWSGNSRWEVHTGQHDGLSVDVYVGYAWKKNDWKEKLSYTQIAIYPASHAVYALKHWSEWEEKPGQYHSGERIPCL